MISNQFNDPQFACRHKESFIRKGCTRDWKNHMTREQSDRLDELCRHRLAGTVAEGWWQEEMRWDDLEEDEEKMAPADESDSGLESADEASLLSSASD
jgi:hypothetical protein